MKPTKTPYYIAPPSKKPKSAFYFFLIQKICLSNDIY